MAPYKDDVRFVVASTYRTTVLHRLMNGPATPSMIAEDTTIARSHVSRALSQLCEHGLVDPLVAEDQQMGRIYGLIDHGTTVWETLRPNSSSKPLQTTVASERDRQASCALEAYPQFVRDVRASRISAPSRSLSSQ